jgi:hypothetical protein
MTLEKTVRKLRKSLRETFDDLGQNGWRVVQSSTGPLGEVVVELELEGLRVRLFHEKGDPTIEVGSTDWTALYAASTWREFLSGRPVDARTSVDVQAAMLRSDMDAIRSAIASGAADQDALRAIATRQRWAIPGWPN